MLILNADGSFTYSCIDTSDTGGCSAISGMIPGIGVCNITNPLPPGESECGVVSAGKDIIVNLIVNSDSEEQELSILLKRGNLSGDVGTLYNVADYFPDDTQTGCTSTYAVTVGPAAGAQGTGTIAGTVSVPYTSGPITGNRIEYRDALNNLLDYFVISNDGTTVRFLEYNGFYLAKDCDLSAPSPHASFTTMYNGMVIDQTANQHQVEVANMSNCVSELGSQKLLVKVENVRVQDVDYPNALVWYYLDTDIPYASLDFAGRDTAYGITLPTSFETGGFSVTAFDIYGANNTGQIAQGDVAATTGTLNDAYELVPPIVCP